MKRHPGLRLIGYGYLLAVAGVSSGLVMTWAGISPSTTYGWVIARVAQYSVFALAVLVCCHVLIGPWWRSHEGPVSRRKTPKQEWASISALAWLPAGLAGGVMVVAFVALVLLLWGPGSALVTRREVVEHIVFLAVSLAMTLMLWRWSRWYDRKVTQRFLKRTAERPLCFACGYDMRGSASASCPECGYENALLR